MQTCSSLKHFMVYDQLVGNPHLIGLHSDTQGSGKQPEKVVLQTTDASCKHSSSTCPHLSHAQHNGIYSGCAVAASTHQMPASYQTAPGLQTPASNI
jgi:hypothetical protein